MSCRIQISNAFSHRDSFRERVQLRLDELSQDLGLAEQEHPQIEWNDSSRLEPLCMAGVPVAMPKLRQAPSIQVHSEPPVEALAEQVSAALIRNRYVIIEATLAHRHVPTRQVLQDIAKLGLTVDQLYDLDRLEPTNDLALAQVAADRHPPRLELLLHRDDLQSLKPNDQLRSAAEAAATVLGMPFPVATLVTDPGVELGRFRLRVREIRSAVQPEPWEQSSVGDTLRSALVRAAPELFDLGTLLSMLLDEQRTHPGLARAALERASSADIASACREVLDDRIGLVDPQLICEAVTSPPKILDNIKGRPLKLFGATFVIDDPRPEFQCSFLVQRLRALLVPAHLRRRAGDPLSLRPPLIWTPNKAELDILDQRNVPEKWTDCFAEQVNRNLGRADILVVPSHLRYRVRRLLRDKLPDLLVVAAHELPPFQHRFGGHINVGVFDD